MPTLHTETEVTERKEGTKKRMVVRKPRRVVWPTEREKTRAHLCLTAGGEPSAIGMLTTMGTET